MIVMTLIVLLVPLCLLYIGPPGLWSSTLTGSRPPPSSYFTLTSINKHQAMYFGGDQHGRGVVSDLYFIDFDKMV